MEKVNDWKLEDGKWIRKVVLVNPDEKPIVKWENIPITKVPVDVLLETYEDLVLELSDKELELYNLKEEYLQREHEIIQKTNFKELYGANNEKVRKQHVKEVLGELVGEMKSIELKINFIKNYIPLLREVIHSKRK